MHDSGIGFGVKRSLAVSLVLVGAAGCSPAPEECTMMRDVYADLPTCEADWTTQRYGCEIFLDRTGVPADAPGNARFYGPMYPNDKRPTAVRTPDDLLAVGSRMERSQIFPTTDEDVTGVKSDGTITRGGFGRCTSSSS